MSTKTWIIFIVAVVGLLGGLVVYSQASTPSIDISSIDANAIQTASEQNGNIAEHTYGTDDGKVTLIEYGDFQCPYCGQAYPGLKSVLEDYSEVVTFAFRNFPITSIHPNARAAAAAAEAAGLQGNDAYWNMHDLIYNNQSQWESLGGTERSKQFANYAERIGIDVDAYTKALEEKNDDINQKIAFDMALATEQDVDSTPTLFLNGEKLDNSVTQDLQQGDGDTLRGLLDDALADAGIELPTNE